MCTVKRSDPRKHVFALLASGGVSVLAAFGCRIFLPAATAPITQVGIVLVSSLILIAYLAKQERNDKGDQED